MPLHMWAIVMFLTGCHGFASAELFISFFLFVLLVSDACLLFDDFASWLLEYLLLCFSLLLFVSAFRFGT